MRGRLPSLPHEGGLHFLSCLINLCLCLSAMEGIDVNSVPGVPGIHGIPGAKNNIVVISPVR